MLEATDEREKTNKPRMVGHIIGFSIALIATIVILTRLVTPYQVGTNTAETVQGMYAIPDNSIQVAYFGASSTLCGVSPMDIYEEYGINGYNCATSDQPMIAGYYLFKELLSHQKGSLKSITIEPSVLLLANNYPHLMSSSWAERVINNMKPSITKIEAEIDCARTYNLSLSEQLFPLLRYHDRWAGLTQTDFEEVDVAGTICKHGEYARFGANVNDPSTAGRTSKKNSGITTTRDFSIEDLKDMWEPTNKAYLDEMVKLAEENGISVTFITMPRTTWKDDYHDSIQVLSDEYGVPYLDLSMPENWKQMNLSWGYDFVDKKHANVHGSEKLSHFIGGYLSETYDFSDDRESPLSDQLNRELDEYKAYASMGQLLTCDKLDDYLDLIDDERYTVFVAVNGDVSDLTSTSREKLRSMGLEGLASVENGESYVGALDGRQVLADSKRKNVKKAASAYGQLKDGYAFVDDRSTSITDENGEKVSSGLDVWSMYFQPNTEVKDRFKIASKGRDAGESAKVYIHNENQSEDAAGINFVVLDRKTMEIVDTSAFDPKKGSKRVTDLLPKA